MTTSALVRRVSPLGFVWMAALLYVACDSSTSTDGSGAGSVAEFNLGRASWHSASLPIDDAGVTKPDDSRVRFFWYNIEPELGVRRRDLNPTLDEQQNTLLPSLDIELDQDPSLGNDTEYAGVMARFPKGSYIISPDEFLEIWVNDFKPDALTRGGQLHIDFGVIDENFFALDADSLNDEDAGRDDFVAGTDDTGLDGRFDADEPSLPNGTPDDPSGDNIDLSRIGGRFTKINGTEANSLHDTEDLDRNGEFNRVSSYFSYTIDLADSVATDIRRDYPGYEGFNDPGHENDSWRLYRIPLSNYAVRASGPVQPSFDELRHVRIWFDDLASAFSTGGQVGSRRIQVTEFAIKPSR